MFRAWIRSFYQRFLSLKGSPRSIAMGLALGVFVGVTPTIPFHTAIIVLLALLLRQNITAAYLGAWIISNPVTIPFLYVSQYELGRFFLGVPRCQFQWDDYSLGTMIRLGTDILIPLLTGGLLMAPFFAAVAYILARRLIMAIRTQGGA